MRTPTREGSWFWIANAMTAVRVPLAGALWLAPGDVTWVVGVFVVAGLTDAVDGRLVRWAGSRPGVSDEARRAQARLGAWLDPVCDKLFMLSAVVALLVTQAPPVHFAGLLLLRDVALALLTPLYYRLPAQWRLTHPLTADWWGKITTGLQAAALLALLFWRAAFAPLAWVAGIVGAASVVHYVLRVRRRRTVYPE